MPAPSRPWLYGLTIGLVLLMVGFSLGAVSSARAQSGRAPASTLQVIIDAIGALSSGLRPPSNGQTRLLFPIVSTEATNEAQLFIVNTGVYPTGTPGRSGECTFELFGKPVNIGIPDPLAVSVGTLEALLINDAIATSFSGYAVATCNFPLAHGFYLQSAGASILKSGDAMVLPPTRDATTVESLGQ
jgi:hypothetical protein